MVAYNGEILDRDPFTTEDMRGVLCTSTGCGLAGFHRCVWVFEGEIPSTYSPPPKGEHSINISRQPKRNTGPDEM